MRIFYLLFALLMTLSANAKIVVGVVLPMEHAALQQIVEGLKSGLQTQAQGEEIVIDVQNAAGDTMMMRSIIQAFQRRNVDLLVPVGLSATQMALSLERKRPILGVAANIADEQQQSHRNLTALNDEIPATSMLEFMLQLRPSLKKITLIYSASDKVIPEVQALAAAVQARGIALQKLMATTMADLHPLVKQVDQDADGILVLKDHLVVSGITVIAQAAHKLQVPLVTSDEGSLRSGGSLALGVHERQIGEQAALMARQILSGKSPHEVPIYRFTMKDCVVFINATQAAQVGLDVAATQAHLQQLGYVIEVIS
jgi:putative ABC transport system substrate-binding protein